MQEINIEKKVDYDENDIVTIMFKIFSLLNCGENIIDLHKEEPQNVIKFCRKEKMTTNCLTHAMLLSAVYSSLGIFSRIVRCLPVDLHYKDCHVITEVFLKKQNKWIFLDPANEVCFVSPSGIMSTYEVRRNLIKNDNMELICGPHWEKRLLNLNKDKYISYLKKNFIRFNTPIDGYNNEKTLITLVPNNYYYPLKKEEYLKVEIVDDIIVAKIIYTTSAELFWKSPE